MKGITTISEFSPELIESFRKLALNALDIKRAPTKRKKKDKDERT